MRYQKANVNDDHIDTLYNYVYESLDNINSRLDNKGAEANIALLAMEGIEILNKDRFDKDGLNTVKKHLESLIED